MTNPIDPVRLILPDPALAQMKTEDLISVKNWSVGTLLNAIVVNDQDGQLTAHIVRDGEVQKNALTLPEKSGLKAGQTVLLKVLQLKPFIQLQITTPEAPVIHERKPDERSETIKPTALFASLHAKNNSTATVASVAKRNTLNTSQPLPTKTPTAIATEKLHEALLAETTPQTALALTAKPLVARAENSAYIQRPNTSLNDLVATRHRHEGAPVQHPQERAMVLVDALKTISKTIWPQQEQLKKTLPALLASLRPLAAKDDEFVAQINQWKKQLVQSSELVIKSPSTTAEKSHAAIAALPKPLQHWFRQWLQHDFFDHDEPQRNSDSTTKTITQLLTLLRHHMTSVVSAEPHRDDTPPMASKAMAKAEYSTAPIAPSLPAKINKITIDPETVVARNETTNDWKDIENTLQTMVSRLQQHSLSNLQSEARGSVQWNGELPIIFQNRCDVFDVMIEPDKHRDDSTEHQTENGYVIRLRFDLPELGPCQFIVRLHGQEIRLNVYSERASTQQQFAQTFDVLAQWLTLDALHLNESESFTIDNLGERMR